MLQYDFCIGDRASAAAIDNAAKNVAERRLQEEDLALLVRGAQRDAGAAGAAGYRIRSHQPVGAQRNVENFKPPVRTGCREAQ